MKKTHRHSFGIVHSDRTVVDLLHKHLDHDLAISVILSALSRILSMLL